MKRKSIMLALVTIICILMLSSATYAQTDYVTCSVKRASSTNGATTLLLGYVSGDTTKWTGNKWFSVVSSINNQALAVGLSAIALDMNIRVGRTPGKFVLTMVGLEAAE